MASVVEQSPFNLYVGNGVTTVFPYEFTLLDAADLVVSVDGVVIPASNFTLAGVGVQAGGTVTFLAAPAASSAVLLSREIELSRATDYQINGDLRDDTVDNDFNRLWQAIQGLVAQLGTVLRLPYPEQAQVIPARSTRALRLFGFDANGDVTFLLPTPGDATALALDLLDTASAAKGAALVSVNQALSYPPDSVGKRIVDLLARIGVAEQSGLRNRIINGNFSVNQRAVSGTVTLGAGAYGHDRWKAGASGCTYTFATVNNVTTLTISAGSLQQVIEGLNLETSTYCMSWTGTAQGKIGAGSFSATGVTGSVTGGTNTTVEFGAGTLSQVQLEAGSLVTAFERRPIGLELSLCQRYFRGFPAGTIFGTSNPFNTTGVVIYAPTPVQMRVTPSISGFGGTTTFASEGTGTFTSTSMPTVVSYGGSLASLSQAGYTGLTVGRPGSVSNSTAFGLSAEL